MANFNSGFVFNSDAGHNGFFWNGAEYIMIIRLHEIIQTSDEITELLAKYILTDNFKALYDSIIQTALYGVTDNFWAEDNSFISILFEMADSLGFKDELSDLIVLAYLYDKLEIIDEVKQLGAIIEANEDFVLGSIKNNVRANNPLIGSEEITVFALMKLLEESNLDDLNYFLQMVFSMHDNLNMTDHEPPPKTAISDWIIGVTDDYDSAYDWFLPFGLKVDWGQTNIQVMPTAELTTIEMPGVDSSLIEDTVYKDRLFQIVSFSEQGLTVQEKEDLKRKIANILSTTKFEDKKLSIQSRGISFDARFEGTADIKEGPSYVKATIPIRCAAYGYDMFEGSVVGSGLIVNEGVIPVGVTHKIQGRITNPSFTMGGQQYVWYGTVQTGEVLTIDHEMYSVWITDVNGKQHNVLANFSGKFQKIPAGSSVAITVPSNVHIESTWKNPRIW